MVRMTRTPHAPAPRRRPRAAIAAPALVAIAGLLACRPPLQNGGVEVRPGAAERLAAFCRWRRPDPAGPAFCAAKAPEAKGARAYRLGSEKGLLAGPLAGFRAGDWALESGEIVVVVGDPARGEGDGGSILDAADARGRSDALGRLGVSFGGDRSPVYADARGGVTVEGSAFVELHGADRGDAALAVTTRYEVLPGARAVRVTTSLENRGAVPIGPIDLGDRVAWGGARPVGVGPSTALLRSAAGPVVAAIAAEVAYAILPAPIVEAGDDLPGAARRGPAMVARGGASDLVFRGGAAIDPGERATYARLLVVAVRGDELAIAAELDALAGGSPGAVEVRFADGAGRGAPLPEGANVRFSPVGREVAADDLPLLLRVARATAIAPDRVGGEVPAGRYEVTLEGSAIRSKASAIVQVLPAEIAHVTVEIEGDGSGR